MPGTGESFSSSSGSSSSKLEPASRGEVTDCSRIGSFGLLQSISEKKYGGMASLYSASRAPMASSSSGEKGSRSRSWRTERMAFCDCQRQSSQSFLGTLRQSGWRLDLAGGSSSSNEQQSC